MNPLFDLHPALLLPIAVLVELVLFAAGLAVLRVLHRDHRADAGSLPVAPFFVAVTTLWALFVGFLAADIWAANRKAGDAAQSEAGALVRLRSMADPALLDLPGLDAATGRYLLAVTGAEWGANRNERPAAEVERALFDIRRELLAVARTGAPAPVTTELSQAADQLQQARGQRLAIGAHHAMPYEWLVVTLLGWLCHVAIASVHADRPAAARKAMAIFGASLAVCFWGLALHANPYAGAAGLGPERLGVPSAAP